jgi:hypothetical protein
MKTCFRSLLFVAALVASVASPLGAQTRNVSDIVGFLMTNQAVPTDDLERDRAASEAAADVLRRALLVSLTSVPITTSSGGFVYRLNPELGTVERATESFGGFFVERALTPGHGRTSFGVSGSTSNFDNLDGHTLGDGSFVAIARQFRDEPAPFDVESLTLHMRSSAMTVFASVGIGNRLEIGAAVPFLRLSLEGERINVLRGQRLQQAAATAVASGIGDAAVRAKYILAASRAAALAIAGEVRLPTGDEMNLLGAGSVGVRVMGIGSYERNRMSLHGNAGIVRGGVSDEVTGGGAAAIAMAPQLTLTGELATRYLSELRPVALSAAPHPTIELLDTLRLTGGEPGRLISTAIAGLKWNPGGTFVLAGHLRWNLTNTGLTAPITPSLGIEYAF